MGRGDLSDFDFFWAQSEWAGSLTKWSGGGPSGGVEDRRLDFP
jgi:hypothetical protein